MSNVGDNLKAERANWTFGGGVAENFDDHVSKSVPLYNEGHTLVCDFSDFFMKRDSLCYEIGSSTGALTLKLAEHHAHKPDTRFIGVDREEDMVRRANAKTGGNKQVSFVLDDVMQMELEPCDMIVCYYTMQFIRPSERQRVFDKFYEALNWGGALLLFEKVRGSDGRFQDMFNRLYDDYKLAQGYTPEEIVSKSRSLKGVLEPFSTQGNIDLMQRSGFEDINTILKYICFEGFVAIK